MESCKEKIKVGGVAIDPSEYPGEDLYSDGVIENNLLEACKAGTIEEMLHESNNWSVLYHLSDMRENIIEWYPIEKDAEILEIGSGCGGITGILSEKAAKVTCIELSKKRSLINAYRHKESDNIEIRLGNFQDIEPKLGKYDFVTLIGVLEYSKLYIRHKNPFLEMINIAKKHLKKGGKLFIAIENKMGLKYWNGATEDHTGKQYSGLNDYIDSDEVRTFSRGEIIELLEQAGFPVIDFYYPVPDYKIPTSIYSDAFQPVSGMLRTYKKVYSKPRFYNFMEDVVCDQLCRDGMFGYMSNSFVVIAGEHHNEENVVFAKYNRERKEQYRISTYIKRIGEKVIVEKKALTESGVAHVVNMKKHEESWDGTLHNIHCVKGIVTNDSYIVPYVEGTGLDELMYQYRVDSIQFIDKMKFYLDQYFTPEIEQLIPFKLTDSFIKIFGEKYLDGALCMKVSNVDMLFSNIKISDGKLIAFDFEWVFDFPIPYKYILWRAAKEVYYQYAAYLKKSTSYKDYMRNLEFNEEESKIFENMEKNFGFYIYGENRKEEYLRNYEKSVIMQENRFC